jgi:hypothetical protein
VLKDLAVLILIGLVATAIFGCSDETIVPDDISQNNTTSVIRGEIDPDEPEFEYIIPARGADPVVGPFVLRGSNIHFVDSVSALSVDFTIENDGETSHPLPIGLTFVAFVPTDVTVENPDNDENGPGASIIFAFTNRDDEWTPGEKSVPRQTLFGVDEGESFGFIAQVVIPDDTTSGTIGGIVWNDLNEDGVIDNDEPGIGGAVVFLVEGNDPAALSANDEHKMRTETAPDGSYRFDDLEAGFYQVIRDFTDRRCFPTTPTVINVVLVEKDGVVNDFLLANFGCVGREEPPPPRIEVGDYVKVNGDWVTEGEDRLMARSIELCKCESPPPPDTLLARGAWDDDGNDDGDDCDGDHDWDDDCHRWACYGLKGELRGPVTGIDRENCDVEIMGSWVHIVMCDTASNDTIPKPDPAAGGGDDDHHYDHPWLDLDDVEIGDRVRVRVMRKEDDDTLYGFRLKEWNGTPEKVAGIVDWVSPESGPLEAIRVLGVTIVITQDTDIDWRD